jgi:DNA-binding NtrC family response regulator
MAQKTSVLYVDDEEALRVLVGHQLSSEGFQVATADDGDTAIEMLGKNKYDVIVLDIRMERVSGIEVLKHVKEEKINSRVIVLTGVDDLTIAVEAVKNGANDYITKPFDPKNLVSSIRRMVAE